MIYSNYTNVSTKNIAEETTKAPKVNKFRTRTTILIAVLVMAHLFVGLFKCVYFILNIYKQLYLNKFSKHYFLI